MVIRNHYHEVLTFAERLMIFIIRSLQTKEEYKRLTKVVEQVFPGAGNFKLPPGDDAVRITFAEGIRMLKEAGIEADEMADLRYGSSIFTAFSDREVPLRFHPRPASPSFCTSGISFPSCPASPSLCTGGIPSVFLIHSSTILSNYPRPLVPTISSPLTPHP